MKPQVAVAGLAVVALLVSAGCSHPKATARGPVATSPVAGSSSSVATSSAVGQATPGQSPAAGKAAITIDPATSPMDSPVAVTIAGLPTGATTTVTASMVDGEHINWSSSAQFIASATGSVSLTQASVGGSYTGANPMGLFESMEPAPGETTPGFVAPLNGFTVKLTAAVAGKVVATQYATRQTPDVLGVTPQNLLLASSGIDANIYLPATPSPAKPAVLVVGGSDGGFSGDLQAWLLASHGYPAMALAYFAEPGLPDALANVPLEYFVKALHILAAEPGVDSDHLLVWGMSRGSEAALLLGADYPALVHGVIATVPSSVVNGGYPDASLPAWTQNGKPVPAVPVADSKEPDPASAPSAVIPVEKIDGPVFLVCGGADQVWPSCGYAAAITQRLQSKQFAYQHVELAYPAAGDGVGALVPYIGQQPTAKSVSGEQVPLGDAIANADADDVAWPELLAFLGAQ